jgi:hypothetical protein
MVICVMAFLVFQSPNLWITKLETPVCPNLSSQNFLMSFHTSRPSDRNAADQELSLTVKKATSPEETAPKQKHVRSKLAPPWVLAVCSYN